MEYNRSVRSTSKTPLFIGIGVAAAIGIGAFVMFSGGGKQDVARLSKVGSAAPPTATAPNLEVRTTPTPTPIKVIESPKPEPKPVVVAKAPEPVKTEPPKVEPKKEEPKPAAAPAMAAPVKPVVVAQAPTAPKVEPSPPAPAPSLRISSSPSLPPELAALDAQFIKLQSERVTAPFEADVAKLNTSYLGGIGKKIAEEKAAGHLDAILALEAEKKNVERVFNSLSAGGATAGNELKTRSTSPVPESDDEKTPASLKALRAIYREQFTKLAAARAANLQALTDPLDKRLAQMETDFTKADRLADAKVVRGYREALAESSTSFPTRAPSPGGEAAKMGEADKNVRSTVTPAAVLALKDGYTNTLGMKFVPVKDTGVLFCIHETRYKDYTAYAAESPGVNGAWKNQTFDGYAFTERKEEHPVVQVSWEDAQKFCAWLSKKEGKLYRLPTDEEWSIAVGLGRKEKRGKNITPAMLSQKENTEFPWGDDFPPKGKEPVGNYSDESRKAKAPNATAQYLENYDDDFPTTAPVMSFKPNKLGLYDLGGNVWEWCEDWYDNDKVGRVLRGSSCLYIVGRSDLLSSYRFQLTPGNRYYDRGFRCVVVPVSAPKSATP